jgi:hypothetical protein
MKTRLSSEYFLVTLTFDNSIVLIWNKHTLRKVIPLLHSTTTSTSDNYLPSHNDRTTSPRLVEYFASNCRASPLTIAIRRRKITLLLFYNNCLVSLLLVESSIQTSKIQHQPTQNIIDKAHSSNTTLAKHYQYASNLLLEHPTFNFNRLQISLTMRTTPTPHSSNISSIRRIFYSNV